MNLSTTKTRHHRHQMNRINRKRPQCGRKFLWIPCQSQTARNRVILSILRWMKSTSTLLDPLKRNRKTTLIRSSLADWATGYQSLRSVDRVSKMFSRKVICSESLVDLWSGGTRSQKWKLPYRQRRRIFSCSTETKASPTAKSKICSYPQSIFRSSAIKIPWHSNFKALDVRDQ